MKTLFCMALCTLIISSVSIAATIRESSFRGMKSIEIENRYLRVTVLPDRGANIISVFDKHNGREWMWHNDNVTYKPVPYNSPFDAGDYSGFDDCFPTVGPSIYPDGAWKGIATPDHGELWTSKADVIKSGSNITFRIEGKRLPYIFEKQIILHDANKITIKYKVSNPTAEPIKTIWAAHAMLKTAPGMSLFLPGETEVIDGLGSWDIRSEYGVEWIELAGPETHTAIKKFTKPLPAGWGGLYDPKTNEYLAYIFNTKQLPYIGIWINQGAYPNTKSTVFNAGLEPTYGDENYELAEKSGMFKTVPARSSIFWDLNIVLGKAEKSALRRSIEKF